MIDRPPIRLKSGGGTLKIASVGPHLVVPGMENGSKLEVMDYSDGPAAVSDTTASQDSTGDFKKESQNFSRIFDLLQEAEKKKKSKHKSKVSMAYSKYRQAINMYSGPRLGTTYDSKA